MKTTTVRTDVDEEELKVTKRLMDEAELKKLERLEKLGREVSTKRDAMVMKQQKVIDILSKEKDALLNDLGVMASEQKCVVDKNQAQEVNRLFNQGDTLDLEIAREKKLISDLEEQIHMVSLTIDRKRKTSKSVRVLSDYGQVVENKRVAMSMEAWKSKLHADQVQLSTTMQDNAALRKKIEVELKSKKRFNELFEELVQKLNKGKRILTEVLEQSKAQISRRDEVSRKIQALKDKDAVELVKRQEEMQNIGMKLNEETVAINFKQQVLQLRGKLSDGLIAKIKEEQDRKGQDLEMRLLQKTWENVREKTKIFDAEDVCNLILRQDAENFSLFNHNNEVRDQLEVLTEKTSELMQHVKEKEEEASVYQEETETEVNALGRRLSDLDQEVNDTDDNCDANYRLFDRLLSKIKALFEMTKCDPWPMKQLLGEKEEVTEFNFRLYLDVIETKIMELLRRLPSRYSNVPMTPQASYMAVQGHGTIKSVGFPLVDTPDKKYVTKFCPECEETRRQQRALRTV